MAAQFASISGPSRGRGPSKRIARAIRRIHASHLRFAPIDPSVAPRGRLLYDQGMKQKKRPSGTGTLVLWLFGGMLAIATFLAPSASADIYRWEDESGVIHFTDDLSAIPAKYRGKTREIQKTPPAAGQPSHSTMGGPSSPPGPSFSPRSPNGETLGPTGDPAGR